MRPENDNESVPDLEALLTKSVEYSDRIASPTRRGELYLWTDAELEAVHVGVAELIGQQRRTVAGIGFGARNTLQLWIATGGGA